MDDFVLHLWSEKCINLTRAFFLFSGNNGASYGILYLMKHRIQLVFIYTDKIRVLEMQMYGLEFSDGQQIDSSVLNLWQTLKFYSGGFYLLIRFIPSKMKRIPLLTGKKHIAVFGSTEGESSDDSLVDLVSAENWSIAELPKHCFYQEMASQRTVDFGRQSHVTFYERLASSQTTTFCKELIFELVKIRKIEVLGK